VTMALKLQRAWAVTAIAGAMIGLACTARAAQEHRAPASTDATDTLYVHDDLLFLTHMIAHHEQALELAALMPSRTQRDELLRFARNVDSEQRAEIEQMKMLLRLAEERGIEIPMHRMHEDPPMPGMLSRSQMAAIAASNGSKFERLWLEGMILHHEGALDMARAQQQRQFESGRRPYGIDVLLDDILVVQRAEITKMRAWLAQ
jgi:uncharacterized protein (DUF305 family)